jgi:hypothetical protein
MLIHKTGKLYIYVRHKTMHFREQKYISLSLFAVIRNYALKIVEMS